MNLFQRHHLDRLRVGSIRFSQVLFLAGRDFFRDNGSSWAAAIAYYSLLSLFPLLLAAGSIAAWFVEPAWAVHQATNYLGDLLPAGTGAIERIVKQTLADERGAGLFFIVPLLWTGSLVFDAITKALNVAFAAEENYGLWKRAWMRLLMLLTIGGVFLIALASSSLLRILQSTLGVLPGGRDLLFPFLVHLLPPAFIFAAFLLSYRFVPRRHPDWRAAVLGAGVALLLVVAARPLFLGYVHQIARYNFIYGSLAGIIVLILWIWVVAMIGLFGGQVAAHSQAILIDDQPLQEAGRQHPQHRDLT
ncbi:MAG: YihY/virulence factor BrkB family protein [Chthoniobacter sp.]|uniref:YihY/virulence factor BrkB family protein n=1 Tax=Chthoniobacter sp. TaxID=2510640 RepID=UPI0032A374B6